MKVTKSSTSQEGDWSEHSPMRNVGDHSDQPIHVVHLTDYTLRLCEDCRKKLIRLLTASQG